MEDSFTGIVDVGSKPIIAREAVATGVLRLSPESLDIVKNGRSLKGCLLYTSPSPRDATLSRMPSSA